ncbi:MAG: hypothetical protein M1482_04905 [Chloroflexi bacterium]|nr:hypothetical protein [Chloroflexota bacterium]
MSAPLRKPEAPADEPVAADQPVTVAINQALHPMRNRAARQIVIWLAEHQDELPSFGNFQVDITPGGIRARVLKSFEAVKIDG